MAKNDRSLLRQNYRQSKGEIRKRLEEFSKITGSGIFYELCFCLLTPQSNAKSCDAAVKRLMKQGFFGKELDPKEYVKPIRFYNNKTSYLIHTKNNYPEIKFRIDSLKTSSELREWLVKNVKGFGYKEASHFLRNTGHRNLAILDRHIMKNLLGFGVIDEIPKSLTAKKYLEIEKKFRKFSGRIKIPMDELDLLFWSMETGEIFK
ncbi:MAG: N-glycosylase/DNA lyase [Candidatus Diapherotrites archaeon]